jgi:histidyl-tRNA synthetase
MQAGNPMRAFTRLVEKGSEIVSGAPSPMEFLNDESRAHLRSVLEYTENMGIPYELDTTVLGSNDCWQHTTFELRTPDENGGAIVVARGGRHNTLAQKSFRVDLPVVSAVIEHEIHGRTRPKRRAHKEPKFFFAQLGPQAKMKSFVVLENLREAGVPIRQQIAIESIGSQLKQAEEKAIPYTVIIGHKEALENTAIVRNMRSRSQVVIPLANLPGYLKRLRVS